MKTKLCRIFIVFLLFASQVVSAQEKTITGTITDNDGLPLFGVNILVKGTTTGTQSDFDGNYTIKASDGQVLVFSYVGFVDQEITASGNSSINVTLDEDVSELDTVVVTALGIKKEKKALGYAVTELSASDLEQRANGDITKILRGKAAGVNVINASGLSGAGSSINIRGLAGLGANQPLYVVDGVRFNSNTNGTGFSGTSRSLDIDPNNIDTINVLKGLTASALYGADGANGVIIITTKSGNAKSNYNKKTEITFTAGTFINDIASLPDYTNERGQGYYDAFYNFFGNFGATFGRPGVGNVDSNGQVPNTVALNSAVFQDAFPDLVNERVDFRNFRSQENFFRTGIVKNFNVNINGGGEKTAFNISLGNIEDQGFLPGNTLRRNTISVGGSAKLTNKFTANAALNYVTTSFTSPFTGAIFNSLYNTPRSIDLEGQPNQHPITGQEISFQTTARNPYWVLNNTGINEDVTRVFGNLGLTYDVNNWLSFSYRYGDDTSIEQRVSFQNRGNVTADNLGSYATSTLRQRLTNHTLLANISTRFADDKFGLSINAGADVNRLDQTFDSATSTDQTIFGALGHEFFVEQAAANSVFTRNRPGVLAQVGLDYNNYLFINLSARNDWTSNFNDNSQFYPGVSLSFIPTQSFQGLKGNALSYLKLRAGYGTSASFDGSGGFPTFQSADTNSEAFIPNGAEDSIALTTTNNTLSNSQIGPALIEEIEFGFESKWWKNRFTVDATYFSRITNDLIFNQILDPSTGFSNVPVNINEFVVDGIEVEADITLIDNKNFYWNLGGNFTQLRSEVTELEGDRTQIAGSGTVGNFFVEGQPVNLILGTAVARDENGNLLIDGNSQYIQADDIQVLGDPTPDFTTSFFTSFGYKNLTLTANLQYRQGGDFHSATAASLLGRGLTSDTDGIQNQGIVLPGIVQDTGLANTQVISSGDAFFNNYIVGTDEFAIFDGTTIRLQEVALTYKFTDKQLAKTPFGGFSIALTGENLYFNAINIPDGLNIDTNAIGTGVNSNGAGIETGISPSSRRIGFNIKASF